jgi:hypothetical protein
MRSAALVLIILLFAASKAVANEDHFYCSGLARVDGWEDRREDFELAVDADTGVMNGYPMRLTAGCMFGEEATPRKCSINESEVRCECKSSKGNGLLQMSRSTSNLKITTFAQVSDVKSVLLTADFSCKKVGKKP